jgi:hypothetical protein
LVDCDTTNGGCNGGWYVTAWTYLKKAGGSAKQTLYNYTAKVSYQFDDSFVSIYH